MKLPIYKLKGLELKDVKQDSPLDKWFYRMIQKSEDMLTISDIGCMLRQEVYLDIAIPLAWKAVLDNPFCGELYDGQMISNLTDALIKNPSMKNVDLYAVFDKKIQQIYEAYDWGSDFDKEECKKLLIKFKQLFCSDNICG